MSKFKFLLIGLICPILLTAQVDKKTMDKAAIRSMAGCYDIVFDYAETFSNERDYQYQDNYKAFAREWIQVVEESEDYISLQHLLVINDSMIIKHWRQDWIYQNTDLYLFDGDGRWVFQNKTPIEVAGQWTQKVYQVDDGPRYEGSATWVHVDGRHFWENTTPAPLPRRERTKRNDYNIMLRGNRHELTDTGWIHVQDNKKLLSDGNSKKVIAEEKGLNSYTRIDEKQCELAKDYWQENQSYWGRVVDQWNSRVFKNSQNFTLNDKIEGKRLYEHLFFLSTDKSPNEIGDLIETYVKR